MRRRASGRARWPRALGLILLGAGGTVVAQQNQSAAPSPAQVPKPAPQPPDNGAGRGGMALFRMVPKLAPRAQYTSRELAGQLMQTPTTNLFPGSVAVDPGIVNPVAEDTEAVKRGMEHYSAFNCVGCHAPNGSGGEGPSLSDSQWIYGSEPADIYLTLVHGRPNGMPAFGAMLPDQTIWELVAYINSISEQPGKTFGRTISRSLPAPAIEQVPAEFVSTTDPWQHVQPFTAGQPPPRSDAARPTQTGQANGG